MNYKKKSIYCTEKIKTVTTTQTTINIVQNINNNKNTATVISKPNKNTSNVKKQIPLSSYARSKVGSSIANAFDTLDFKIYHLLTLVKLLICMRCFIPAKTLRLSIYLLLILKKLPV